MASSMAGNATLEQKQSILDNVEIFGLRGKAFADNVARRVRFVEASLIAQEHGPKRLQARVIGEIIVEEGRWPCTTAFDRGKS